MVLTHTVEKHIQSVVIWATEILTVPGFTLTEQGNPTNLSKLPSQCLNLLAHFTGSTLQIFYASFRILSVYTNNRRPH